MHKTMASALNFDISVLVSHADLWVTWQMLDVEIPSFYPSPYLFRVTGTKQLSFELTAPTTQCVYDVHSAATST